MSSETTHNSELLQLIATLEAYVLNDDHLREVYNQNKSEFKNSFKSYLKSLQNNNLNNQHPLKGKLSKKSFFVFGKTKQEDLIHKINTKKYNNLLNEDKRLIINILKYEMLKLLKNKTRTPKSNKNILNQVFIQESNTQ